MDELARIPPATNPIECLTKRRVTSPLKPRLLELELPEVSTYETSALAYKPGASALNAFSSTACAPVGTGLCARALAARARL
ncbi:MAG TPA: hypothetical protein VJ648_09820 [Vicinamibacteria bacterium]|nr:hypothetical protein [Vicinamibacteria bacterium]